MIEKHSASFAVLRRWVLTCCRSRMCSCLSMGVRPSMIEHAGVVVDFYPGLCRVGYGVAVVLPNGINEARTYGSQLEQACSKLGMPLRAAVMVVESAKVADLRHEFTGADVSAPGPGLAAAMVQLGPGPPSGAAAAPGTDAGANRILHLPDADITSFVDAVIGHAHTHIDRRAGTAAAPASGQGQPKVKHCQPFGPVCIDQSQVFYQSEHAIGLVNIKPVLPGHVLVISRRRCPRFIDLSSEEVTDLWLSAQQIGRSLEQAHGGTSLTLAIQDGADAGQSVPHVHIHILPRKRLDLPDNDQIYDMIEESGLKQHEIEAVNGGHTAADQRETRGSDGTIGSAAARAPSSSDTVSASTQGSRSGGLALDPLGPGGTLNTAAAADESACTSGQQRPPVNETRAGGASGNGNPDSLGDSVPSPLSTRLVRGQSIGEMANAAGADVADRRGSAVSSATVDAATSSKSAAPHNNSAKQEFPKPEHRIARSSEDMAAEAQRYRVLFPQNQADTFTLPDLVIVE